MSAAPVDIKESLKWGIRYKSQGIILVHNHPSGDPEPSQADLTLTRKLQDALNLVDIRTLDHFVVAGAEVISFAERGLL